MMVRGDWRFDFGVREKTELAVPFRRGSVTLAGVTPEVDEKIRVVLGVAPEIVVPAQIDLRVEYSGLGGAVSQGPFGGQPGDEVFRAEDSGGGESGEWCGFPRIRPIVCSLDAHC